MTIREPTGRGICDEHCHLRELLERVLETLAARHTDRSTIIGLLDAYNDDLGADRRRLISTSNNVPLRDGIHRPLLRVIPCPSKPFTRAQKS